MKRLFGFLSLAVLALSLSACGTMGAKSGHKAAVVDQSTSARGRCGRPGQRSRHRRLFPGQPDQ